MQNSISPKNNFGFWFVILIFDVWILNFMKYIKIKKIAIVVFSLWSLVFGLNLALAVEPQQPFLPFYWIRGTISGTTEIGNRTVVFYKDDPSRRVQVRTNSSGRYELNAYELSYYMNVPVTLDAGVEYKIGVARYSPTEYGTEESLILTTEAGYMVKDLTCVMGGGPLLPPEAAAGTVPLFITRDGTNIKVTWEAIYISPEVYVLTGDGVGRYTNSNEGWVLVAKGGVTLESGFSYDEGTHTLLHLNQVGGGTSEAYYKALQAGVNSLEANRDDPTKTNLAAAWAVGKVNVVLPLNTFKLINIPFVLSVTNVREVIGDQLSAAKLQYNENGLKQIVLSGGSWDSEINLQNATGYWLKSTDRDAICTFYGSVVKERFTKRVPQGWDLYGYPLPKKVGATTLGITPVVADKLQILKGGALVQYYYGAGGWDDSTFEIEGREGFWYRNPQTPPPDRYLDVTP